MPAHQVKLLLGKVPSPAMVARFGLEPYQPIIDSVKTGDIAAFERGFAALMGHFL